jgi:hypothetical protein
MMGEPSGFVANRKSLFGMGVLMLFPSASIAVE